MQTERFHKSPAIQAAARRVSEFSQMLHYDPRLKKIPIPSQFPRTDSPKSIMQEGLKVTGNYTLNGSNTSEHVVSTSIPPAAPHTTAKMPFTRFAEAMQKYRHLTPVLATEISEVAAQMVAWVQRSDGARRDVSRLAELPDTDRQTYLDAIERESIFNLLVLRDAMNLTDFSNIHFYGLFGHATSGQRRSSGLGRGAQSAEPFHVNQTVIFKQVADKTTGLQVNNQKKVSPEELVKHDGPWDTIMYRKFKYPLHIHIEEIAKRRIPVESGATVTSFELHSTNSTNGEIGASEGFTIDFSQGENGGIDFSTAMNIVLDVVKDYGSFYTEMLGNYGEYYKNIADKEKQQSIRQKSIELAYKMGFNDKYAHNLVDLVYSIPPTHGQLRSWIQETSTLDDTHTPSLNKLKKLEMKYTKRRETNYKLNQKDTKGRYKQQELRDRYKATLRHLHGLEAQGNDLEADLLLTMAGDKYKLHELDRDLQFIWPLFLSGNYDFDYDIDKDNKLVIKKVTLGSKLVSNKGAFEDKALGSLDRSEPTIDLTKITS